MHGNSAQWSTCMQHRGLPCSVKLGASRESHGRRVGTLSARRAQKSSASPRTGTGSPARGAPRGEARGEGRARRLDPPRVLPLPNMAGGPPLGAAEPEAASRAGEGMRCCSERSVEPGPIPAEQGEEGELGDEAEEE